MMLRRLPSWAGLTRLSNRRLFHHTSTNAPTAKSPPHVPVMADEVVACLKPTPGKTFIDMTFGAGGHSRRLLEAAPNVQIIALDRDSDAIEFANELKEEYPDQVIPLAGRFSELPSLLKSINVRQSSIDGILFDFGCSSMQMDSPERGFAISRNAPLDMRMDRDRNPDQPTAADVLAKIDEQDLARILKVYGDEKNAKKIARAIIDVRYSLKKIETTRELANIVASCFPDEFRMDSLDRPSHVATKTFQALRIFVNNELNELNYGLLVAEKYLKTNGRLATITFHSLEDTIVKRHLEGNLVGTMVNPIPLRYYNPAFKGDKMMMDDLMESCWQSIYKHVLTPTEEEIAKNPRSRSAKLRGAFKIK